MIFIFISLAILISFLLHSRTFWPEPRPARSRTRRTPAIAGIALVVLLSYVMAAADDPGRITVTVTDPSGAVVPASRIQLRNPDTGEHYEALANAEGSYVFPALPVGRYEVTVSAAGFQPFVENRLQMGAGTTLRVDAHLTVKADNQSVVVEASAAVLDASNTQLGEAISGKQMTATPLNGRSYTDLLAMQAGVVPISSQQPNAVVMSGCTSTPPSGDLNAGNMSISGQRETANGFAINGSNVEEGFNMGTAIVPNLDSIEEFRLLTGNFDAQYGNYSGGQVLVTTKSGTNEWHGSGFEFLRNTALDARNYLASERATYERNQYGGTVGGPVVRDKVYFFADYQGTRMTQGVETGLISVPSLQDRSGDFADVASSLTGAVNGQYWANLLSQKLGYTVTSGEPYYTSGCGSVSQCVFPGAVIPQSAWSAPAKSLLPYIPRPNQASNIFSTSAENQTLGDNKGSMRLDGNTRFGMVSGYYFADSYSLDSPFPTGQGGANVPGFNAITQGRAQLFSLGLTTTHGTSTVNELRFSYMRNANRVGQPVGGVGPSLASQGFVDANGKPGIVPLAPQIEGIENVSFNDFTIGVDITGEIQVNNTYEWSDNFSRVIGKHSLKFGGDFHLDQININPDATYNGAFVFQGTETGSDFADFLLGIASSYEQGDSLKFYMRNKFIGLYGQDSWRMRPNLTLNYGLRWDVLPPWHEKYNQLQTLVLGQQSQVYPGAPAGLVFPSDKGIPSTLAPTKWNSFAPRIGVSYSPSASGGILHTLFGDAGMTSIHAGFGVFYTAFEGLSAGIMSANPPYGYDYTSLAPPLFNTPFISANSGQNIGQRFPSPIPPLGASVTNPNNSVDWSQYSPITGVPSFYYRNVPPYTESYNLTIERQIGANSILSVGYVGTQAHHLLVLQSANPGNAALCLGLSQPGEVAPGSPTCGPFGESGVYTTAAGQVIEGTRGPFSPQFAAVTYQKTIGNSNYNALQVNFRHTGGPLELLVGYTYSKSLDDSSSLAEAVNPFDVNLSKALSAFDMRRNFVISYAYKLPFEKLFGSDNRVTSGWTLSGITRFSTGLPVTLYNNTDSSLLGTIPNGINTNGIDTPEYSGAPLAINLNPRNRLNAFDTRAFSLAALGSLGNAPRRFFYGPGIENFDMALQKNVAIGESKSLQFRVEAFNVFNHAQFYGPAAVNGNITSANFGQVVSAAPPRQMQIAAKFYF
jgi:Carboxypeptidase regulatory-like domain